MPERRYDAVMFDLDGTLLDTIDDLADSMNEVLVARGHPAHPVSAYCYFVGDGIENLVRRALPETARSGEEIGASLAGMQTAYQARWNAKSRPYDGIADLLAKLSERGLRLAVLSNKPDTFTKLCVAEWLDESRFDIVRGARPDVPRKPDPTAAIEMAEEMDVAPERFLYLGDTNTDMRTARGAGMYAVGAAWGFRPEVELVESGAQVVIRKPEELLTLI